jgi:hypothetical protein
VLALSSLASQLPPQHSQGDPCLPVEWDWVSCNNASPPQVTTIALSNKNLSGTIPNNLATMTALQSISLDYNNFTGPIPDLSSLSSLQFLYIIFLSITPLFCYSLEKKKESFNSLSNTHELTTLHECTIFCMGSK